ncbi:uncharacterized protein LOC128176393 isoform X2 [Crassostrea angulata]|uniref:uncharacterized protein LOC128176393 isoform X2 n=1 Tax=Magallana angulata TaxID=2784310 RepID=UPI0022B16B5D|nr:uncharacterized protein LOC128176393 isoform X2 [Crassostrea angulata]
MSMANVKMESNAYLAFMMILSVQGEFISNFMLRNSSYDNRATYAINVIFTSNCRSRLDCASRCTAWGECKSVMFNMDTRQCQLLSVHMDDQSNAGPHTSVGWLYYERKTEDEPNTATETADLPTTVISTETSQSSSPNVATDLTTVVNFETTTTSEDEPNTATETADLPTTVISTETSQSSSPNVATDLTTVVDFETTTTSEDEPNTATETADLPTTVISTETSQSSSPNVATDLTTVVDFETTTTSEDEPNTATETADLPTTVISTETSQSSSPNVATDLTTVVDFETTTTSEDEPNTATETADLPTTVISTETSQSSSPNVATDLTTVVDFETTTTSDCSLWHYRFGHWYLLDSNNRTFNDSRTFCASLSPPSYVIEVQSQEENNWLIELKENPECKSQEDPYVGSQKTTATLNCQDAVA